MKYTEIEGNLITLAQEGKFDVIVHGVNCFCTMKAGIAPQMAKAFGCDKYPLESRKYYEDINKLGQIDWQNKLLPIGFKLSIVNAYTQYDYNAKTKPFNYAAFQLCLTKINHIFKGKHIGLPQIGCGLAGASWVIVKTMILETLVDDGNDVTIVIYKP